MCILLKLLTDNICPIAKKMVKVHSSQHLVNIIEENAYRNDDIDSSSDDNSD